MQSNETTTLRRYVISSITTFLAAFFGVLALQLQAGVPMDVSLSFILGLVGVAGRAGVKAVVEWAAGAVADK